VDACLQRRASAQTRSAWAEVTNRSFGTTVRGERAFLLRPRIVSRDGPRQQGADGTEAGQRVRLGLGTGRPSCVRCAVVVPAMISAHVAHHRFTRGKTTGRNQHRHHY
jgi:hypothetical protein